MHKFHFRPGKSAFGALLLGLSGALCLWFWWIADEDVLIGSFGLLMVLGAGKLLADALSETPALAFDEQVLRVRKVWGGVTEVHWREVQHIGVDVMTLRYWGIIPIAKHEFLVVRCDGSGWFGSRKLRLALKMVMLPPGGSSELMGLLYRAHVAAAGGGAMSGAGQHSANARVEPAEEGPSFDADAALARYLARKEASATPDAAPAAPVAPPRPVFGRKAQAG